jgi:hypothetical protein
MSARSNHRPGMKGTFKGCLPNDFPPALKTRWMLTAVCAGRGPTIVRGLLLQRADGAQKGLAGLVVDVNAGRAQQSEKGV